MQVRGRWLLMSLLALLLVTGVVLTRGGRTEPSRESAASVLAPQASGRTDRRPPSLDGDGAPARQPPTSYQLAATVVSVAPAGASVPESGASAQAWDAALQAAREPWRKQAQQVASACGRGDERQEVELLARLVPVPRPATQAAATQAEQVMMLDWISAAPETLELLAERHDVQELLRCLQQVRSVALRMPVGSAPDSMPPPVQEVLRVAL